VRARENEKGEGNNERDILIYYPFIYIKYIVSILSSPSSPLFLFLSLSPPLSFFCESRFMQFFLGDKQQLSQTQSSPAMTTPPGFTNLFAGTVGKSVPKGLNWTSEPIRWMYDDGSRLIVQPRPQTDFFNAYNAIAKQDACFLYHIVQGDFTFISHVGGSLVQVGDAVAVTIWSTPKLWAKMCLQRIPSPKKSGEYQIVSVVSNPFSDVTNGELMKSADCHLRITRRGDELAMHFSRDGKKWKFARYFVWGECPNELAIGIHAQAPLSLANPLTNPCCMGEFYDFCLSHEPVKDFKPGE